MKFLKSLFLTLLLFVWNIGIGFSQCAMCRTTIENNVSNGDTTVGAGLNMGILYLLSMPYLLALVLGFFWYRQARNRKRKFLFHGEKY